MKHAKKIQARKQLAELVDSVGLLLFVVGTERSDSRDSDRMCRAVQRVEAFAVNWQRFGIKSSDQALLRQLFPPLLTRGRKFFVT